jgi:ABC-type antimicrobial peptide transport system permease subunit
MEGSKAYQLNKEDLRRILIGASVAVGGALVTYVADTIPNVDFGSWTPVVVAFSSILVNAARKFIADHTV